MLLDFKKLAAVLVVLLSSPLYGQRSINTEAPFPQKQSVKQQKNDILRPIHTLRTEERTSPSEMPDLDTPPSFVDVEEPLLPSPPNLTLTIPAKKLRREGRPNQEGRIMALVNNEIISLTAFKNRLRFQTRGHEDAVPKEHREKFKSDLLRAMIDEAIKLQYTKMMGITIDDDQIKQHLQGIEKHNKFPAGKLTADVKNLGLPLNTLYDQVRAELAWTLFIQRLYQERHQLHKNDIRSALRKDISHTPQYHLAEIVMYVDGPESMEKAQETLTTAMNALKNGQPFPQIAFQYSESPSMVNGGNIGWVHQDMLEPEIAEVVEHLAPGQLSMPIETPEALKIVYVIDKKGPSVKHPIVTARQLNVRLSDDVVNSPELLEKETQRLNALVATVNTCRDFEQLSEQIPNSETHMYQDMRLLDLTSDLKNVMESLDVGQPSHGIWNVSNKTLSFFLICRKEMVDSNKIAYMENKENEMLQQRFTALSEQNLRHFRRMTAIEIRS